MTLPSSKTEQREKHCGCHPDECVETDYNTQKSINTERASYCSQVYEAAGEVNKWEASWTGEGNLFNRRKCMFVLTEENFQRYRNTEMTLGTEMLQSTTLIKDNVKNYIAWGSTLSGNLKDIFKKVKDAKAKLNDLVEAACKLDNSKTNTCYQAEWTILTGKTPAKCGEQGQGGEPPKGYPDKCKDIDKTICEMLCMPKALNKDINHLFKASSDIIGIQIFSNIGTLDALQAEFEKRSKVFDAQLQDVVKAREGDLKELQKSLVKSVQETTKAASALNTAKSSFEALYYSARYFCCPHCGCLPKESDRDNCEERLKNCECCICDICGHVKETFCPCDCDDEPTQAD